MEHKDNTTVGLDDTASPFYRYEPFETREELVYFVKKVGKELGFVLKISRSDLGKRERVVLGCERGGIFVPDKRSKGKNKTGSKKANCPFTIYARPHVKGGPWKLQVKCGTHNHLPYHSQLEYGSDECANNQEKALAEDHVCHGGLEATAMQMTTLTSLDLENAPATCDESIMKSQEEQQTDDMAPKKTEPSKFHVRRHTRSSAGFVPHHLLEPYIESVNDVDGDGNCGFRTVSMYLHGHENHHKIVRLDLMNEMKNYRQLYMDLLGGTSEYDSVLTRLHVESEGSIGKDKWMVFPDMGCIIASTYNVVCVLIPTESIGECMTFLPYNTTPPARPRIWVIGRIASKEHFVQVNLCEGSPLPPVYALWRSHRSEEAREWEGVVADRIRLFQPFLPESHTTGETIELD